MKKKTRIMILLLIICLSLSYVFYSTAKNSKKIDGNYIAEDGVLISEMSGKDKKEISQSYDIQKGKPSKNFDSNAYVLEDEEFINIPKEKMDINFVDDFNKNRSLHFEFITKNDKQILLPVNEEEYYSAFKIPSNKSKYIIQYNYSIYLLDIADKSIKGITKDTDVYKKVKFKALDSENFNAIWSDNPCINLSGDKLTYYTNRNATIDDKTNGEIWLLNINSGEEYSLGEIGYTCLGWDPNDNVYYLDYFNNIIKVNVASKTKEIIYKNAPIDSYINYPYLIIPQIGGLNIINLADNNSIMFDNKNIGVVFNIVANNKQDHIIFGNQPDSSSPFTNLVLFNMNDKKYNFYTIPNKATIDRYSWIDDNTILLSVREFNSVEQTSYILNNEDFSN